MEKSTLTEQQKVKLGILAIAEVLEVELPAKRLAIYAKALADLGGKGMERALAAVLADPYVKAGVMILPGKIRELAFGTIDDEADAIVEDLLRSVDDRGRTWHPIAHQVATAYGLSTLRDRRTDQVPTIMAQLRSLVRTALSRQRREQAERTMLGISQAPDAMAGILESLAPLALEGGEAGHD